MKPSQAEQSKAKLSRIKPSQGPRPSGRREVERKKTKKEGRGEQRKEGGHTQHAKCSQLKPRERDRIKHTCRAQNSAKKVLVQSVSRYAQGVRCSEESATLLADWIRWLVLPPHELRMWQRKKNTPSGITRVSSLCSRSHTSDLESAVLAAVWEQLNVFARHGNQFTGMTKLLAVWRQPAKLHSLFSACPQS